MSSHEPLDQGVGLVHSHDANALGEGLLFSRSAGHGGGVIVYRSGLLPQAGRRHWQSPFCETRGCGTVLKALPAIVHQVRGHIASYRVAPLQYQWPAVAQSRANGG